MLNGYVDECVNHAITTGLRGKGMDLVTAKEQGQLSTDDEIILETAASEGRLLLTCDPDFLRIHNEWMTAGKSHAGIVFWPQAKAVGKVVRAVFDYASNTTASEAINTVKFV